MQLITVTHGETMLSTPNPALALEVLARITGAELSAPPLPQSAIPAIGKYWVGQGGVYAGMMRGEDGQPDYPLIVPIHESVLNHKAAYGGYEVDEPEAGNLRDGLANTTHLVYGSGQNHPAAEWCESLEVEGHLDLYLPSIGELALIRANVPELFDKVWHLSSSQRSADIAFYMSFGVGYQGLSAKYDEFRVRPVRRFIR